MLVEFGQALVAGLGLGSIYAMIACGYTLVLGASGVLNFALGAVIVGGALVSFGVGTVAHLPMLVVLAIVLITGAAAGLLTHTLAVLPFVRRRILSNFLLGTFLATLGLGLAMSSIIALSFSIYTYPVRSYVSSVPFFIDKVSVSPIYVVMIASTIAVVVVFEVISRKTTMGLIMRAVFNDGEGTALLGVSVSNVVRWVFVGGSVLAALAGFLLVPITDASSAIGNQYAFYGFAAMAIGGFGSFAGAILGGAIVGLVSEIPLVWITPSAADLLVYACMVLVLVIRPQGLFGSGGTAFGAEALRDV